MHPRQQSDKVLIIYHGPYCNDGFTSAWIAARAMKKQSYIPELYPMNYGENYNADLLEHLKGLELDYARIYVVDFSLKLSLLTEIVDITNSPITILDHHKSAFEEYGYPMTIFTPESTHSEFFYYTQVSVHLDNSKSGAGICWNYFNNSSERRVPWIVKYVQDRDLFKFEYPYTSAIHMYLDQIDKTLDNWEQIHEKLELESIEASTIVMEGNILLKSRQVKVAEIANQAVPCKILGEAGLMVQCEPKYSSDVGNILAGDCGTYGLCFSESEDGETMICSLRSEKGGDFDVQLLAKAMGGGGHKHAAGFRVSVTTAINTFEDKGIRQELDFNEG